MRTSAAFIDSSKHTLMTAAATSPGELRQHKGVGRKRQRLAVAPAEHIPKVSGSVLNRSWRGKGVVKSAKREFITL